MHLRLLIRALSPWPPFPKWPTRQPRPADAPGGATSKEFLAWLNPIRAWRQLRSDEVGRAELSAGLAMGAFIANLPAYGAQTLLSLYAARRLHLHPLSVVAGSQLSTPPIGPLLAVAAIGVGHLLLHGAWPSWSDYDVRRVDSWAGFRALFRAVILEWTLGSLIVGFTCAIIVFITANRLMRWVKPAPVARPPAAGAAES
jgi:uncharacterized protein (DUF2062 family)